MKKMYISGLKVRNQYRRLSIVLTTVILFAGCSYFIKNNSNKASQYSKTEVILSDFSKKIVAYYERQNQSLPEDFDERQFIEVLKKVYPDQSKVEMIKRDFKIKAHTIDHNYSVVLCDPNTDAKLMEDLSCTLNRVDIRFWDKESTSTCEFEENWELYCK